MTNDTIDLLTDKDVASAIKLSRSSVWRLAKEGKLPKPVKIGGAACRWRKADILAAINAAPEMSAADSERAAQRSAGKKAA